MIDNFGFTELKKRGWVAWDKPDNEGFVLMLCPLEDFKNVPDGTVFDDIFLKRQYVKGLDKIDEDTRAGMMAFGVRVKEDPILEAALKVNTAVVEQKLEEKKKAAKEIIEKLDNEIIKGW